MEDYEYGVSDSAGPECPLRSAPNSTRRPGRTVAPHRHDNWHAHLPEPPGSEPVGNVSPIGARLADEGVVKAQGTGIQVLLIKSVGEVLPVCEILDPRTDHEAALAGAFKCHTRVDDAI